MAFSQVNTKVVAAPVVAGRAVLARRGAMLAYTGEVGFSPVHQAQGGIGGMVGRMASGEHVPLMAATGDGTVYYGYRGMHVTIVELDGSGPLSVEANRLVAYDDSLQSSVVFLGDQGGLRGALRGAATGQGLFTTQLQGAGSAALLSHGGTIAIPVGAAPTAVDPQAYVGHTGHLRVEVTASVGWRDAVGRGSGEAVQLRLTGSGTVYVQASEQRI